MFANPKLRRGLLLIGQLALAGIFLASGYFKLREPWLQFAASLSGFKLLPDNWLEPVAKYLPWAEVALGVWILSGILLRWSAGSGKPGAGLLPFRTDPFLRDGPAGGLRVLWLRGSAGADDDPSRQPDAVPFSWSYNRGILNSKEGHRACNFERSSFCFFTICADSSCLSCSARSAYFSPSSRDSSRVVTLWSVSNTFIRSSWTSASSSFSQTTFWSPGLYERGAGSDAA